MRCANSCLEEADCRRIDCCHNCAFYVRERCVNDGTYPFLPRYFVRLSTA